MRKNQSSTERDSVPSQGWLDPSLPSSGQLKNPPDILKYARKYVNIDDDDAIDDADAVYMYTL